MLLRPEAISGETGDWIVNDGSSGWVLDHREKYTDYHDYNTVHMVNSGHNHFNPLLHKKVDIDTDISHEQPESDQGYSSDYRSVDSDLNEDQDSYSKIEFDQDCLPDSQSIKTGIMFNKDYKEEKYYDAPETPQEYLSEKPALMLRDSIDYNSIFNAIDRKTGKLRFKLPLVDLPNPLLNIQWDFSYDSSSDDSNILGMGWFTTPKNLILFNHQSSVFNEDHSYYIIFDGLLQKLFLESSDKSGGVLNFKLKEDDEENSLLKLNIISIMNIGR